MTPSLVATVILLATITSCATTHSRPAAIAKPTQKLQAKLILSKRVGFAPQIVTVRIFVKDPNHELSCPAFVWDCGNGQPPSTAEPDCEPGTVSDTHGEQRRCYYGAPGDYEVRGWVIEGQREIMAYETIRMVSEPPMVDGAIIANVAR